VELALSGAGVRSNAQFLRVSRYGKIIAAMDYRIAFEPGGSYPVKLD
jgi:hypothetical protein